MLKIGLKINCAYMDLTPTEQRPSECKHYCDGGYCDAPMTTPPPKKYGGCWIKVCDMCDCAGLVVCPDYELKEGGDNRTSRF